MIIYGSRAKQVAQETLLEKCPNCGTSNSVSMHVFQKYAHIFWIPAFPLAKTGVSQCQHCKQALRLKEMPVVLRTSYDNLKQQTKTPLWMFIGLALLSVLIASIVIDENKKSVASAKYIEHLQPNDLLATKTDEGYTYMKVTAVYGDTVYIRGNRQAVNLESGLSKLGTGDGSFYNEELAVTQASIKEQYKQQKIVGVLRQ